MPKNTIKAKNTRKKSNKKTGRDYAYDKAYQATEKRKKYRAQLNKKNRDAGTYGNKDGKDMSHTTYGGLVIEKQSTNRARN